MSEGHEEHGQTESHEGSHSTPTTHSSQGPGPRGVKSLIFIVFVIAVAAAVFIAVISAKFITDNLLVLAIAAIAVFFIIRYDYVLKLKDYERAVIFSFGRVSRVGGPGWTMLFPPFEEGEVVDLRTKTIDIPKQEVVTKDGVEVTIDVVVYLSVNRDNQSVINSVTQVNDYVEASKQYIIGILRDKAGSFTMTELVSNVEHLNAEMKEQLHKIAKRWGVNVEEAVIKDINIPKSVLDAMHEQKAAVQRKLARIEAADAHRAEIDAVRQAAEQLGDKAIAYYYIRALEKLGEGKSTKFIFPMELSRLAQSLSGRSLSEDRVQELLEQYAPALKAIVKKK